MESNGQRLYPWLSDGCVFGESNQPIRPWNSQLWFLSNLTIKVIRNAMQSSREKR